MDRRDIRSALVRVITGRILNQELGSQATMGIGRLSMSVVAAFIRQGNPTLSIGVNTDFAFRRHNHGAGGHREEPPSDPERWAQNWAQSLAR